MLLFLLRNKGAFIIIGIGTRTVELGLRTLVDTVARGTDILQDSVDLGRAFLGNLEAEEGTELSDDGLHAIHGIALRLGGTSLIETLQLAPEVL